MRANNILTKEITVAEYLTETQVYIETMKKALIQKITNSEVNNHSDISSIDRLLEKFLSVN